MDFSSESEMLEGRYKPAVDMNKHFDPSERLSEQYIPRAPSHDEPPSYTTAGSVNLNKYDYLKTTIFNIYLCCEFHDQALISIEIYELIQFLFYLVKVHEYGNMFIMKAGDGAVLSGSLGF